MAHLGFLETTAEVAVTFVGFISLFVVLARRDGSFANQDALAIRVILLTSLVSLFYAVMPILLAGFGLSPEVVWRSSSVVMLGVGVGATVDIVRRRRSMGDVWGVTTPFRRFVRAAQGLNGVGLALQLSNVVGWPLAPNGAIYVLGLWLVLGVASLNFVALVLVRVLAAPSDA